MKRGGRAPVDPAMNIPLLLICCCLGLLCPEPPTLLAPSAMTTLGDRDDGALEGGRERSKALVIVLHGGSWRPRPAVQLARTALGALSSEARRRKLRLLAPVAPLECRSTVPWLEPLGEAAVLALIEREVAAGRADVDRVYLAGHGSGATAALVLASRHPQRFAAVAAWSGTPPPLWDETQQVVGLAPDPVPGLKGVPVYLWTSDEDPVLDREALRLFVETMKVAEEFDPSYELDWDRGPGGHDYGEAGPREGLKFLRAHRRQGRP